MTVVTRFAPSPTGYLHIGGARTALFNWLFARHHGGIFRLRIEDTDRARSTADAVEAIYDGLRWLGLDWDGEAVSQFARADLHAEAARRLLEDGKAYRCYATPEELAEMRERARASGGSAVLYDGRWRDRDPADAPPGVDPVIRLKAPRTGDTRIDDLVQGTITVANDQLDDMVLLRADSTPTYMLAVVVDDHDMEVTHVIRGDDHLTNAFRQTQLYRALGWQPPAFAHIPLIHGADGAKLSKRHGAHGVGAYRDQGLLPEAVCNYLLRLGWSHGDEEIIDRDQAVAWFNLGVVGRSPARFDPARLESLNGHYIRAADDRRLVDLAAGEIARDRGARPSDTALDRLARGMPGLKQRAKTILELTENSLIYALESPPSLDTKAAAILDADSRRHLARLKAILEPIATWNSETLEATVRDYVKGAEPAGLKLRAVAQPLRAALTGSTVSPPVFEVMDVLGRDETLLRLGAVTAETP